MKNVWDEAFQRIILNNLNKVICYPTWMGFFSFEFVGLRHNNLF